MLHLPVRSGYCDGRLQKLDDRLREKQTVKIYTLYNMKGTTQKSDPTLKVWFYILLMVIGFVPSYIQDTLPPIETTNVIRQVLRHPMIYDFEWLFVMAKLVLVMLFIGPLMLKNSYRRMYPASVSVLLCTIIVFQNTSSDTDYGMAVLVGNMLIQTAVLGYWIHEAIRPKNDFTQINVKWWNGVMLVLAVVAFWMPANDGMAAFHIKDILFNEAGVTFCMVIPVLLSSIMLFGETINVQAVRITSFVGLYFGLLNMLTWFVLDTQYRWMGVMHLPLLVNSFIAFIISLKIQNRTD